MQIEPDPEGKKWSYPYFMSKNIIENSSYCALIWKMSQHSQNIYEEEYHDLLRFNSHSLEELLLKLTALSAKSRRNPGKTAIITKVQTICQKI